MAPINLDPEELIANYKPLPQLDVKKKKTFDEIDPLAKIMKTKNIRYFILLHYDVNLYILNTLLYFAEQKYTLEIKALFIQKFLNYLIFVSKLLRII